MKKPPSASVNPPTQTTQRVPMRSSKPGWASGGGAGGNPVAGSTPGAMAGPTCGMGSGAIGGAASVVVDTVSAAPDAARGSSCCGSGGGTTAGAAIVRVASSAAMRARSSDTWLKDRTATISATTAMANGKKTSSIDASRRSAR